MKICLVGSSGGHLTHLHLLEPFWGNKERFWVTFDKEDAKNILANERKYNCYFPTNRNVKNLIKNTYLAFKILKSEKPDIIISSGAAVAVPFFFVGKLLKIKTVYIEVFDRIDKPTLTGKLVYAVTDLFIVQWEEMRKVYPKAINLGGIF
ncbi:UDP-N-acetylglucosamine--N-acetylmuramyl-(pentapeptide) pyrophosphoryl-undecaprenol N-acetylglucosamine transferase [Enterococcus innesii]|uniref:UDP-N-acetylglucosamine--N-acetylmuramyl-(Pentapeptide) pyrophosphoryl-undecaprenol N-acetylglucosamine transferase n=1 Tax=Enterococcus innesii TaxID=2839759 RepID=A0ABM7XPT5_9ENTE|nr:PssD/Cps14F family polysaccharide biosynthesis glycosyltransferase [Enterococcus innesii]BDG67026.1 UDP-N-acetylglucosamine--N-acetylmuramyl-(pentapeptide) pyrophosphoryl-undecaprenol N-acetylglucosamine transferase [Enterococcus innesii]